MNKVSVFRKEQNIQRVIIEDHAGFADYGKDIVCAGISTVVIGALNAIDQLFPDACDLDMNSEQTRICIQVIKDSQELQKCLEFMLIQLKTIQEQYPEYLILKRKETL